MRQYYVALGVPKTWNVRLLAILAALALGLFLPAAEAQAACTVPNAISNGQVADATALTENFDALKDCVESAVSPSGSPSAGNLPVFSGTRSITSGNLSGDCTTSGTLSVTCTKTNGSSFGPFATGTDAGQLTGTISVNRFNGGANANAGNFLRGDGTWAAPPSAGGGSGAQVVDSGQLKAASATESIFIPNGTNNTPSTSASNSGNLKVTFTVTSNQVVIVDLFAILSRTAGFSRVALYDTSGAKVWPRYPQAPDPVDLGASRVTVYSRPQGEGDAQTLAFTAAIPVTPGTYSWVVRADHAAAVGTATWYDRMLRVQYQ